MQVIKVRVPAGSGLRVPKENAWRQHFTEADGVFEVSSDSHYYGRLIADGDLVVADVENKAVAK